MTELEAFMARGHQKIIEHYRWLRDTSATESERERFQRSMDDEQALLTRFAEARTSLERAA